MTDWTLSDLVLGQVPDGITTPAAIGVYAALLARLISAEAQVAAMNGRSWQGNYGAPSVSVATLTTLLLSLPTTTPAQPGALYLQSDLLTVSPGTAPSTTPGTTPSVTNRFTLRDGSQVRLRDGSYVSHR